ncbi:MAG: MATE family efflux transporter [Spirochaetes bacterium]|nr:MATE family efflux transporter [Spirochaetota bacterium]
MQNGKRSSMLARESIGKLLYKLSLPAIVGMAVQALYNIVDTIFVGQGVGTLGIGSIAIVFPIHMLIMSFGQLIGIGGGSRISRRMGQGDREATGHTLGNMFIMAIVAGMVAIAVGTFAKLPLLRIFGVTDAMLPYALDYFNIIILASPLMTFTMAGNDAVRAEGNAKIAMIAMLIGAGLNILLDPIFIFGLDMGIRGAAVATAISLGVSCIFLISYFLSGKSELPVGLKYLRPDLTIIREIFMVGSSSLVMSGAMSLTMAVVFNTLKTYGGEIEIATFGIIHRMFSLIFMPMIGLSQGMQPIIGFNFGAKQYHRVRHTVKLAGFSAISIGTTGFIIMMIFPDVIIGIFSRDPELIAIGKNALRYCVFGLPIAGFQMLGGGFFQALGKALPAMFLTLSRQVLLFIPLMLILPLFAGITGVWLAFPIADIISFTITVFFVIKVLNKMPHVNGNFSDNALPADVVTQN